jgi:hypothetical protein
MAKGDQQVMAKFWLVNSVVIGTVKKFPDRKSVV